MTGHSLSIQRFDWLQVLRAFAAINVVIFHAIGEASVRGADGPVIALLGGWGQNGVDIFFVISGFLMVHIQAVRPKSATGFFVDRVKRVVPIYWIVTAVMVFLIAAGLHDYWYKDIPLTEYVVRSFGFAHHDPAVYVGWTLNYEMGFYAIFAVSLLLPRGSTYAAIGACALIPPLTGEHQIIYEFCFGMALGLIPISGGPRWLASALILSGVLGLLASLGADHTLVDEDRNGMRRVLLWGLPACLLVAGCLRLRMRAPAWLCMLGDASYSIYLAQVFALLFVFKAVSFLAWTSTLSLLLAVFVGVLFSIALGLLMYAGFERPLMKLLKRRGQLVSARKSSSLAEA